MRSQDAEAVQEESREHGGQDDGQGAEQVGSQEPPDLRLPHGARAAAPARHRVPPRHRHTAAAPQGSIFPELRAQAGAEVRIWAREWRLLKNPNPARAARASYRGARGAARQRKTAELGRRHFRGGAGSGGGCGGAAMVCDKCECGGTGGPA